MKIGDIGEEMVATAIALAKERGAAIEAITVVRVPRKFELEGELPADVAARVDASLEEARALGSDHGVDVHGDVVRRARSATRSSTRPSAATPISSSWARPRAGAVSPASSRRPSTSSCGNAPCEVLVVAFPDGTFEE